MTIPRETNKELVVIVENESIDVAISPPVLDSAIVVGAPQAVDGRTMLFDGFEAETMRVRTNNGLLFEVNPVGQVPVEMVQQVMTGPDHSSTNGQILGRIYMNTVDRSLFYWDGGTDPADEWQVRYGNVKPTSTGKEGQVFIETSTKSLYRWRT